MTNLNNVKNNNAKILDEIKYFAMAGYSVESVDFNDDRINFIRHTESTNHPISLVNYKSNRLHIVSLNTEKPMNQITALNNSVPAESIVNNICYDDYIKGISKEAYKDLIDMKTELQKVDAIDFGKKSELLYSHFQGVNNQFKSKLKKHLESVRNVLINAELCDESFLNNEISKLENTNVKQYNTIEDLNRNK